MTGSIVDAYLVRFVAKNALVRTGRKRIASIGCAALLAGVVVAVIAPATNAVAAGTVSPVVQRSASNVTADPLPTEQIDSGVVWAQTVVGDTVYAGGQFTNVRPPGAAAGTNLTARGNLMAFNINTGQLVTSFAPNLNGMIKVITHSPDGQTLYVGGSFTTANGQARSKIVAYNLATGTVVSTFAPSFNLTVNAIFATATTVFVGGDFSQVNGQNRAHLAAVSAATGALTAWAPTADLTVQALMMSPDGTRLIAGGAFTTINGSPAYGLAALDPTTATLYPWAANTVVRDAGANAQILNLSSDGTYIYSSAYVYGTSGNYEGVMAADPDTGNIHWLADCHGDTYGTFGVNGIVYAISHQHDCANIGGFPDTNPRSIWHRTTAFTQAVTGTVLPNIEGGYGTFGGQPSPSLIDWMPDLTAGTFTGDDQAAWSVTGNSQFVVEGGEFPSVNSLAQYGLVRFAVPALAPNKQGPMLYGAAITPTVTARSSTSARLSWPSNWDRDDLNLTYTVRRADRGSTPIYSVVAPSESWNLPRQGWVDTGLTPGATYSYTVRATDQSGNYQGSSSVSVTLPTSSGTDSQYVKDVLGAGASSYWRLDQASGATTNVDYAGFNDVTVNAGVAAAAAGAIVGDSDTASTFSGTSTGFATTTTAVPGPNTFSESAWFKTTSTTGGKILGFGNQSTGTSTNYDRHIYMDSGGHINFGVYNNAEFLVTTPHSYNDGQYHQVVGTLSSAGMTLYVDGALIGTNTSTTIAQPYNGFWRIGGDSTWSGSPFFKGTIDEVAIYPTVITLSQVAKQYFDSGRGGAPVNQPPVAAFTSAVTNLSVAFNGTGSMDPDGSIASYAWNFGDGSTSIASAPTHVYAAAGTYSVSLTVTDDQGAVGSVTHSVTVAAPVNQPPVAVFTSSVANLAVSFDGSTSSDPDGTIASYAWGFGDTATGTGAKPSHTYAAAGTYTVTLTVTDNQGATNAVSHQVTVAAAANQPPVATFTSTVTSLAVAFDASASTDPDGTISSYAWTFGDTSTGTGETTSHTYAAAGTYSVTLTVTDNQGATTAITQPVTVTTAPTVIAADTFTRTLAGQWGTADTGGAWTIASGASLAAVNGSAATVNLATPGTVVLASLRSVSAANLNATADVSVNAAALGSGVFLTMVGREIGTSNYQLKVRILPGGVVHLVLSRVVNGTETIFNEANVAGLTYSTSDTLRFRFQVSGTGTTTLTGKVWKVGATEPTSAQITASDTTATLQAPGAFGLQSYLSASSTNPMVATWDNLSVGSS